MKVTVGLVMSVRSQLLQWMPLRRISPCAPAAGTPAGQRKEAACSSPSRARCATPRAFPRTHDSLTGNKENPENQRLSPSAPRTTNEYGGQNFEPGRQKVPPIKIYCHSSLALPQNQTKGQPNWTEVLIRCTTSATHAFAGKKTDKCQRHVPPTQATRKFPQSPKCPNTALTSVLAEESSANASREGPTVGLTALHRAVPASPEVICHSRAKI